MKKLIFLTFVLTLAAFSAAAQSPKKESAKPKAPAARKAPVKPAPKKPANAAPSTVANVGRAAEPPRPRPIAPAVHGRPACDAHSASSESHASSSCLGPSRE